VTAATCRYREGLLRRVTSAPQPDQRALGHERCGVVPQSKEQRAMNQDELQRGEHSARGSVS